MHAWLQSYHRGAAEHCGMCIRWQLSCHVPNDWLCSPLVVPAAAGVGKSTSAHAWYGTNKRGSTQSCIRAANDEATSRHTKSLAQHKLQSLALPCRQQQLQQPDPFKHTIALRRLQQVVYNVAQQLRQCSTIQYKYWLVKNESNKAAAGNARLSFHTAHQPQPNPRPAPSKTCVNPHETT